MLLRQSLVHAGTRERLYGGQSARISRLQVRIDESVLNASEFNTAHGEAWRTFSHGFLADRETSRLLFVNLTGFEAAVALDGVRVETMDDSPTIAIPPVSRSIERGERASLSVLALGMPPLSYQWFRNGQPLARETNASLLILGESAYAGDYYVTVQNALGTNHSPAATVTVVEPDSLPRIVSRPELLNPLSILRFGRAWDSTVSTNQAPDLKLLAGYSAVFRVVAAGEKPLSYFWYRNGQPLAIRTNSNGILALQRLAVDQKGADYSVVVRNAHGATPPAKFPHRIVVAPTGGWGGTVLLGNATATATNFIYEVDGITPVGKGVCVQCYSGVSPDYLLPLDVPLLVNSDGVFGPVRLEIYDAQAGTVAYVQLKAWESTAGSSYEEARDVGGKFGSSEVMKITTGLSKEAPASLAGFKSFRLNPGFTAGSGGMFVKGEVLADQAPQWIFVGEPGLYLIERKTPPRDWTPIQLLTNRLGTAVLVETITPSDTTFYRARRLE